MSFSDRAEKALAALFPSLGVARAEARARLAAVEAAASLLERDVAALGYDGARRDATDGWFPVASGPNALVARDGARMRWAARDAGRNDPVAARIRNHLMDDLIGEGWEPRLIDGRRAEERQMRAWRAFVRDSDPEGLIPFHGRLRLAVGAAFDGGFAFLRYRAGPPATPLLVEILGAQHLDVTRLGGDGDFEDFYGVRFDAQGRRVGYWLFDRDPAEAAVWPRGAGGSVSRLVPAGQIRPVQLRREPGEVISASWLAPVIRTLVDRRGYLDAERVRARVLACMALIVTGAPPGAAAKLGKTGTGGSAFDAGATGPLTDAEGNVLTSLAPASIIRTPNGAGVSVLEPKGVPAFEGFLAAMDRDAGAPFGMAGFHVSGDFARVNYSAGQIGGQPYGKRIRAIRADLIEPIYDDAWRRAMTAYARLGRAPAAFDDPSWAKPQLAVADPVKQATADQIEVEAGFDSVFAKARARGRDPEEVMAENAAFRKWAEGVGGWGAAAAPAPQPAGDDGDAGAEDEAEGDADD